MAAKPDEEASRRPGEIGKNENSSWSEDLQPKRCTKEYKYWALDMVFYALTIAIFAATVVTGRLCHFLIFF